MKKLILYLPLVLWLAAIYPRLTMADEWNYPDDIPATVPTTVSLAGEHPADVVRYLLADGARNSTLSPDGTKLAFQWSVSGEPQLWVVNSSDGWPKQLTFGKSITFFEWSPDGEHLLIGRDADGNEREGYYLLSINGTQERLILPLSDAFRRFGMFSSNGSHIIYSSTERNGRDFDIYVANILTGDVDLAYEGTFGFFPVKWQPEGNLVIVSETRGEDANDIHILDLDNGDMSPLFQPQVAARHSHFNWLSDGSGFYMTTNTDREFMGLAFYSLKDERLEYIETPDHNIDSVSLSSNDNYLSWTSNRDGYSYLHVNDRRKNKMLKNKILPTGVYQIGFALKTPVLSIQISGPKMPGNVYVWDIEKDTLIQAVKSSLAGLDEDNFVLPESMHYPARDDIVLQGLLYLPNKNYFPSQPPVVIQVHGGPNGQSRPNFRPIEQYLVNNGIAVFAVNVRGSRGFGKTYARLDNQEKRLDSVRDLVDTVAFLSQDSRIDTNNIAVMGGSYGGYMVNAVLGTYPGIFDAGVSMVGVSDWVRALQEASPALKAADRIEYGDIREDRWKKFYATNSPINNVDKINVPLLVSHGVHDPRDPVTESDRLVKALRDNGNKVIYMRFPDEGHWIKKKSNRVGFYRNMTGFLEQQLKPQYQDVVEE